MEGQIIKSLKYISCEALNDLTWWFFGKHMAHQTEKQREQCYRHFRAQKQDNLTSGASLFLCLSIDRASKFTSAFAAPSSKASCQRKQRETETALFFFLNQI